MASIQKSHRRSSVRLPVADPRPIDDHARSLWSPLHWPVHHMVIPHTLPPPYLATLSPHGVPAGGFIFRANPPRLEPVHSRDGYNPVAAADELLRAIQSMDASQAEDVLRFVNYWGELGVGLKPGEQPGVA